MIIGNKNKSRKREENFFFLLSPLGSSCPSADDGQAIRKKV